MDVRVWSLEHQYQHNATSLEMHILGPTPDLLNQMLWGWSPAVCVSQAFLVIVMPVEG